ncbi:MAG: efflux RND transporter periplasmic adaptor subunit [bacterium]|nr:efflux RND transporter periplasmic adaptor subunit [bacterium]
MARPGKKGLFGIILIVLILVMAAGYFARNAISPGMAEAPDSLADSTVAAADSTAEDEDEDDEKKEPDPVPVEVSLVKPRAISSFYHTTATLEPEKKVTIVAKVAGEVTRLNVEEGDFVKKGQSLCQIEDAEYRIALEEARINRDQMKREFDRTKSLVEQNLISDKDNADAQFQAELAETKYQAALIKYRYTKVPAPFDGVITKRRVDLGQHTNLGAELFELIDPSPLLIRMYLPEKEIRDIHVGQEVTIEPDNRSGVTLKGRVIRIAPEVDDRTGTVKVTAETRGQAMPGSFARIKIVTDTHEGSLAIPRRGLISDAGDLYVYLAEADSVRKLLVSVGYQDEYFAEVLSGLELGDSVVVVGTGGLRTGTKVKVVEPRMQGALSRKDESADDESSN